MPLKSFRRTVNPHTAVFTDHDPTVECITHALKQRVVLASHTVNVLHGMDSTAPWLSRRRPTPFMVRTTLCTHQPLGHEQNNVANVHVLTGCSKLHFPGARDMGSRPWNEPLMFMNHKLLRTSATMPTTKSRNGACRRR